jgi:hypothetical protein
MKMCRGVGVLPHDWLLFKVNGVLCALVFMYLGKQPVVALGMRLGEAQSWSRHGEQTVGFQKSNPVANHYLYLLPSFSFIIFPFLLFVQTIIIPFPIS